MVVFWRSCDWGDFADELRVFKNKKEIIMADIKGTRAGPFGNTGFHDGEQQVVDDHLPEDLWQYRPLLRTPEAFSRWPMDIECPPGYPWLSFRAIGKEVPKEKALKDLRTVYELNIKRAVSKECKTKKKKARGRG